MMAPTYTEPRVRQSELLQLLLLDALYGHSGSQHIIFQGGTALRWVYGGPRFSEDLDFVISIQPDKLQPIMKAVTTKASRACVAQFGEGQSEQQIKSNRSTAFKTLFIYRPASQRERIAVKLEFESLQPGQLPGFQQYVFRDLPQVSRLITSGHLFSPYSSTIILVETPEEILTDKIRALYERQYLKGRDIFDLWWIVSQLGTSVNWQMLENKLSMYRVPFHPARELDFFQKAGSLPEIENALRTDLPRFIPPDILSAYQAEGFKRFILALQQVSARLQAHDLWRIYWK
ncbi:nucleotidyl transferase AbiEii/AbiGii toxin family protein [Desulfatirhabdium butyrativorans]|uniref:nucleotidyl transferase AbiEii/AbiGii toxin family protein n=1 Tax=Desulfatirhabdium butyrativorans TaxID=340467 RepID=UPI00041A5157|nr:nucleotidyl transferase AbiEii/AbiGii toxin family protein [Desulfatirhabdium butyrativorans]